MAADPETLRKLAAAVRAYGEAERERREKRAAHVLRAAAGLTLLREKVRGR